MALGFSSVGVNMLVAGHILRINAMISTIWVNEIGLVIDVLFS